MLIKSMVISFWSRLSVKLKAIFIIFAVLFALSVFGNVMNKMEVRQKEEEVKAKILAAQKLAKEKRDEFEANKPQLLDQAKRLIDQGKPDDALASLEKFVQYKDPDIGHVQQLAQTAKRIQALSDELATKPDAIRSLAIYEELKALQPLNPLWPAIIEEIQPRATEARMQKLQAQAVANRAQDVKRLFSGWDGSVHVVEKAVKARLKDPDSYKHVETKYIDSGVGNIKVFTQYRARNAFNAVVSGTAFAEVSPTGELISFSMN